MADKSSDLVENRFKQMDGKLLKSKVNELSTKMKLNEQESKSLDMKPPNKDWYALQKNDLLENLNEAKHRREQQFKDKRLVDADLKEVNADISTKCDMAAKLKSNLRYKNQDKVDEVIKKLSSQFQKPELKSSEQRRFQKEISALRETKDNIVDYKKAEEEVQRLKEMQTELRRKRDENVERINILKKEEKAAKVALNEHKQTEDQAWATYKDNLSRRDRLREERDELQRTKRELKESSLKNRSMNRRSSKDYENPISKQESNEKSREPGANKMKTIIERKKPFSNEINTCDILLSFLEKLISQSSASVSKGSTQSSNESLSSLEKSINKTDDHVEDDIYGGIRRRPSKRQRRRKHGTESKKIDLHVSVLEKFVSLGIQPPPIVADIQTATDQLLEKKNFYKQEQQDASESSEMKRAKSTPFLGPNHSKFDFESNKLGSSPVDESHCPKKELHLELHKRHKSWPSLLTESVERHFEDLDSPCSSLNPDFSASNSEYDLDSPVSVASSISFHGRESEVDTNDDYMNVNISTKIIEYFELRSAKSAGKAGKTQHKVHFSNEVAELNLLDDGIKIIGNEIPATAATNGVDKTEDHYKKILKTGVEHKNLSTESYGVENGKLVDSTDVSVPGVDIPGLINRYNQKDIATRHRTKSELESAVAERPKVSVNTIGKQNEDVCLQFQMDDVPPSSSQRDEDDVVTDDIRVREVLPRRTRRSSAGCSPRSRPSGQEFLLLEQGNDDIVRVET